MTLFFHDNHVSPPWIDGGAKGISMRQHFGVILLGLALLCGVHLACAPRFAGPTASGYYVAVIYDAAIHLPEQAQLIVRIQNAQGQPLDGIPVTFQVEASWAEQASITPQHVRTEKGIARALFQSQAIGIAHVICTVDRVSKKIEIAISPRPSPPGGA